MKKIGLWGSLASIIALGIAIFSLVNNSNGENNKNIQTHGDKSSAIESKGDVNINYGDDVNNPISQNQTVLVSVNIDGRILPLTSAIVNETAKKTMDIHLSTDTEGRKLTLSEVKQLADELGLLKETPPNIHLSFLDGDIAYWYEQGLTVNRYKLEFGARRAVLDAAEKSRFVIKDQGTLSWAAQQIMSEIIKQQ